MKFKSRISKLIERLDAESLDSFLVTNEMNVRYLTGFRGNDALLLISEQKRYFITDSRYLEEASSSVKGFEIISVKSSTYEAVASLVKGLRPKNIGFESMSLPYGVYKKLKGLVKGVRLVAFKDVIEGLRRIKDSEEISEIEKAARLVKAILGDFKKSIGYGKTEEELSSELKVATIRNGASSSFEPIVAVDENASRPHAIPGETKVKKPCLLMVDLGVRLNGYNSDITRTFLLGRLNDKIRKVYEIVRRAQDIAIKKIAPGVKASSIDSLARDFIRSKGYGEYFGHSLGHGVGMDVHEEPAIAKHNHAPLAEGMVFTIEPAIYIPKVCGVRIEDMVLVTRGGCEIITGGT